MPAVSGELSCLHCPDPAARCATLCLDWTSASVAVPTIPAHYKQMHSSLSDWTSASVAAPTIPAHYKQMHSSLSDCTSASVAAPTIPAHYYRCLDFCQTGLQLLQQHQKSLHIIHKMHSSMHTRMHACTCTHTHTHTHTHHHHHHHHHYRTHGHCLSRLDFS